ncbi:MAG TPA: pyridoxamine 5'-phosphate oxidase family protein [Syntrophomonadaceae bacterium]|nr:pyridoxamine 5'-phosphate oxidase family protein [Syntrophomonadaceae bacterium]HNX29059.1 pyridoxamine 5'-phosphate oxidase family protein [Syntrophomonadaceae bacterium]HPR92766.1 pyridoxamine 5'-phosphate oxidase family protein [Syntrophomonadaceae bacterium]
MVITEEKWKEIVKYFGGMKHTSMIGSVSNTGQPNVTPIGSLLLKENCTGYYFDLFTRELSANLDQNSKVCVTFIQTSSLFWLKSLYANKGTKPAGIKLVGSAGARRKATAEEIELFRNMTKSIKMLKGYNTLFGNLSYVRDIEFTDYYAINTGKMTFDL